MQLFCVSPAERGGGDIRHGHRAVTLKTALAKMYHISTVVPAGSDVYLSTSLKTSTHRNMSVPAFASELQSIRFQYVWYPTVDTLVTTICVVPPDRDQAPANKLVRRCAFSFDLEHSCLHPHPRHHKIGKIARENQVWTWGWRFSYCLNSSLYQRLVRKLKISCAPTLFSHKPQIPKHDAFCSPPTLGPPR